MKKTTIFFLLLFSLQVRAQVKIGDNPATIEPSSILELESSDKALLVSRVANTGKVADPKEGMIIYDLSSDCFKGFQKGYWSDCGFVTPAETVSSNYSCHTASSGTLTKGTVVSGVTQTITATVTTVGAYNISTSANGVTFAGSGRVTATGSQNIVLTATGTPTAEGSHSFTLNTTPNCSFTRTTGAVIVPLPPNITLPAVSPYFIASVKDSDYLPYTVPTAAAELPAGPLSEAADGESDEPLDVQGVLTTAGVIIKIPYTVTQHAVDLPAFSQTINIPAAYTEDGISRDVTFSYPAVTKHEGEGTIEATLKADVGILNVKKLDEQTGIGNDILGVLLAQFTYPTDNIGGTANFEIRAIAAIPDRNIADPNHVMFYVPFIAEDGKVWLNNNLGADYSNTAKGEFNLTQQATGFYDEHAYGSLFQWGRYSDGHELINWSSATTGTPVNGTTTDLATTVTPTDPSFIVTDSDWLETPSPNLWQGEAGTNNPCPVGFRLPTDTELFIWGESINAAGAINMTDPPSSTLKVTGLGMRYHQNGVIILSGVGGYYWTSTVEGSSSKPWSWYMMQDKVSLFNDLRGKGSAVRCIKD